MKVWFQSHDFESRDLSDSSLESALSEFGEIDWEREILGLEEALSTEEEHCCPAGMGFIHEDGRIVHFIPQSDGMAMVHHHFQVTTKILGVFPHSSQAILTVEEVALEVLRELLTAHYQGDEATVDSLLRKRGRVIS